MIEFKLTEEQQQKYDDWHHECYVDAGAIGGRLTFTFIPTGLGVCLTVECMCGEKLNLTDSDHW